MSAFTWLASYSTSLTREPKILEAVFGDGYAQREQDGINANPMKYSVVLSARSLTEGTEIEAFLEARGGTEPFDWTPPRKAAAKFVCKTWNVVEVGFDQVDITATFIQDFAP